MTKAPDGPTLAKLALLDGMDGPALERIAAAMTLKRADPGEVLGREGDPGDTFWLLLEGEAAVSRRYGQNDRVLTTAPAGSILGELAVLTRQPRTATVTASTPVSYAVGGRQALEDLLGSQTVRERIKLLASNRLAQDLRPVRADLPDGSPIVVRPLLPSDRQAFDQEVHLLSRDSLRRRFFSPGGPTKALIDYLIDIDFVDHFAWVALDGRNPTDGLGTARYVRAPASPQAEMAFGTADRHQGRGVGTFLLGAIGVAACEAGVTSLIAHVLADNLAMRKVFAKAGAKSRFDEPGLVLVEVEPSAAADLLPDHLRQQLSVAVRDIVTAASLAVTPPG